LEEGAIDSVFLLVLIAFKGSLFVGQRMRPQAHNIDVMIPEIDTVPVAELASGDRLSIQIYRFVGSQPGKVVYIQSNLHGAEIAGNAVIHQLIEQLYAIAPEQLLGEIRLVPTCNPMSTNQRSHHFSSGRYYGYNGKDWNRIFWDYEQTGADIAGFARSQLGLPPQTIQQNYRRQIRAAFETLLAEIESPSSVSLTDRYRYQLQSLCLDADCILDLHSSTNQALDYLYCFRGQEDSAKAFLFDRGILFDTYDGNAFDEAFLKPWLALQHQFEKLESPVHFDLESWTLELGSGMQINPESVQLGVRGIFNYLAYRGILNIANFPVPETADRAMQFIWKSQLKKYYAPRGGMIQSRVAIGTTVSADRTLYKILCFNREKKQPELIEIKAEKSGLVFDISTNQSVNQGEYILEIMESDVRN
jgi:uncharacterized protein